jgi:gluconolactonase
MASLVTVAFCAWAHGAEPIIPPDAQLELLWDQGEFTEGVASAPDGTIYFSDIPNSGAGRVLKFNPSTKETTVFCADSGKSNGLCVDRSGRLIAACGANVGSQALCEITTDGKVRPIVEKFEGRRFNAPNDLDIHPSGWIYFSDPRYVGTEPIEIDHMSVYRFDPATGAVARATTDITKPNGVALSPDGKVLYVAETDNGSPDVPGAGSGGGKKHMTLNAFPVDQNGNLGPRRIIKDFGIETGIDGMTVDREGRILAAVRTESRPGIGIFDPSTGNELEFLPTKDLPTNCGFGRGDDLRTLYITSGKCLYRIRLATEGAFAF